MLVNGRPEMVQRAVRSFEVQSYRDASLLVLDSGKQQVRIGRQLSDIHKYGHDVLVKYIGGPLHKHTIGTLRNLANGLTRADILCHWDSDDWSHPRRIEEQVALLQSSGKQCVGYRDMLFWDTRPGAFCGAYVYRNDHPAYVIGSSMMYWRTAWEACPFDDAPHEDQRWWLKNKSQCAAVGSIYPDCQPRMICAIHGGNTSAAYSPEKMKSDQWRRAPEWDAHCGKVMEL
jgi:hypothetical protein